MRRPVLPASGVRVRQPPGGDVPLSRTLPGEPEMSWSNGPCSGGLSWADECVLARLPRGRAALAVTRQPAWRCLVSG